MSTSNHTAAATDEQASVVRITVSEGREGLLYAVSPDLRGLLVGRPTIDSLDPAVRQAIQDLHAVAGRSVVVMPLQQDASGVTAWVTLPASATRQALERLQAA